MAGIPVHTSSPINANAPPNPFGASPSTTAARYTPVSATLTPTPTTAEGSSSRPPSCQPGSPAVPAPTNVPRSSDSPSPRSPPTSMIRPAPRPTSYATPPTLSKLSIPSNSTSSSPFTAPPLPQHQRHTSLQTLHTPRHQQPQSATTALRGPPTPYSVPQASQDLSHPPGYVQSPGSFDDRPLSACSDHSPNYKAYYTNRSRLSILDGHYEVEKGDDEDPLSASSKWMWDTAVKWTKAAGTKLKEGEQEVWKRVNGDIEH